MIEKTGLKDIDEVLEEYGEDIEILGHAGDLEEDEI